MRLNQTKKDMDIDGPIAAFIEACRAGARTRALEIIRALEFEDPVERALPAAFEWGDLGVIRELMEKGIYQYDFAAEYVVLWEDDPERPSILNPGRGELPGYTDPPALTPDRLRDLLSLLDEMEVGGFCGVPSVLGEFRRRLLVRMIRKGDCDWIDVLGCQHLPVKYLYLAAMSGNLHLVRKIVRDASGTSTTIEDQMSSISIKDQRSSISYTEWVCAREEAAFRGHLDVFNYIWDTMDGPAANDRLLLASLQSGSRDMARRVFALRLRHRGAIDWDWIFPQVCHTASPDFVDWTAGLAGGARNIDKAVSWACCNKSMATAKYLLENYGHLLTDKARTLAGGLASAIVHGNASLAEYLRIVWGAPLNETAVIHIPVSGMKSWCEYVDKNTPVDWVIHGARLGAKKGHPMIFRHYVQLIPPHRLTWKLKLNLLVTAAKAEAKSYSREMVEYLFALLTPEEQEAAVAILARDPNVSLRVAQLLWL